MHEEGSLESDWSDIRFVFVNKKKEERIFE